MILYDYFGRTVIYAFWIEFSTEIGAQFQLLANLLDKFELGVQNCEKNTFFRNGKVGFDYSLLLDQLWNVEVIPKS